MLYKDNECHPWMRSSGFTLIEVLVVIFILALLGTLVFPSIQNAIVRAQCAKVQTDMISIRDALTAYHAVHSAFPVIEQNMYKGVEINRFAILTTPINYIGSIPELPWRGKETTFHFDDDFLPGRIVKDLNYQIMSFNYVPENFPFTLYNFSPPGWNLMSGGPVSPSVGWQPRYWYSPTNGLYSAGGFYLDSYGTSSF